MQSYQKRVFPTWKVSFFDHIGKSLFDTFMFDNPNAFEMWLEIKSFLAQGAKLLRQVFSFHLPEVFGTFWKLSQPSLTAMNNNIIEESFPIKIQNTKIHGNGGYSFWISKLKTSLQNVALVFFFCHKNDGKGTLKKKYISWPCTLNF